MSKAFFILLLCSIFGTPLNAAVYKWVDEQGQVHYSDQPQDIAKPEEPHDVKVGSVSDAEAIEAAEKRFDAMKESNKQKAEQRQEAKIHKAEADKEALQNQEACDYWTKQLTAYQGARRMSSTDAEGNVIYLDDNDKAERTLEAQKMQKIKCKKIN